MKKITPLALAGLAFLASASADANDLHKYFPLAKGNRWTFQRAGDPQDTGVLFVTQAHKKMFRLVGFPGAEGNLWVWWGGHILWAWDKGQTRWEVLFRFGEPSNVPYGVSIGTGWLANAKFTLKTRGAAVSNDVLGGSYGQCAHFQVKYPSPPLSTGLEDFYFAPKLGLVRWEFHSSQGANQVYHLRSARVGARKYGLVDFSPIESGNQSWFPTSSPRIWLINTPTQWKQFFQKHKPGKTPPQVDFTKRTVLAVVRPGTLQDTLKVLNAGWWFNSTQLIVKIGGATYTQASNDPPPHPYAIVLLHEKVYAAVPDWTLTTFVPQVP
jgi:hypothetical protein